jgi:transposase
MNSTPHHARGKRTRDRVAEMADSGIGIPEIARRLAMSRQTVQRYIASMHSNGTDDPSRHRIRVGGRALPAVPPSWRSRLLA